MNEHLLLKLRRPLYFKSNQTWLEHKKNVKTAWIKKKNLCLELKTSKLFRTSKIVENKGKFVKWQRRSVDYIFAWFGHYKRWELYLDCLHNIYPSSLFNENSPMVQNHCSVEDNLHHNFANFSVLWDWMQNICYVVRGVLLFQ